MTLDVFRLKQHAVRPKLVQREAHVVRVPQDDRVQHKPERTELVLLTLAMRPGQLTAAAVEHGSSEAMSTLPLVDLDRKLVVCATPLAKPFVVSVIHVEAASELLR